MLTPHAFFLALIRAVHVEDQETDPVKYANYFLFLQEVMSRYDKYESFKKQILIEELEEDKKNLEHKNETLIEKLDRYQRENRQAFNETKQAANEAKQAAIEAKDETIRTKESMVELTEAVDSMHNDFTETAYHSAPIVPDNKATYFALTSCINEDGDTDFKTYRVRKDKIYNAILDVMLNEGHELIIPPMYVANSVNVAIVAMADIKLRLREIIDNHNANNNKKWFITSFIKNIGLKLLTVKPRWVENEYITRDDMVNAYLNVIRNCQEKAFQVETTDEFRATVAERMEAYKERIANSTGNAKRHLQDMYNTIMNVQIQIEEGQE